MKILLADKNKHVGGFIKRELERDHHEVILAESAKSLLLKIEKNKLYGLLIIDPDLPDAESDDLLKSISQKAPGLPVIIHSYSNEFKSGCDLLNVLAHIEKKGSSIDNIRSVIK